MRKTTLLRLLVVTSLAIIFTPFATPNVATASHFRSTQLTWTQLAGTTAQFESTIGVRRSFFGMPNVGDTISPITISYGDGDSEVPPHTVITVDEANDWILVEASFIHAYNGSGPYTAAAQTCCRLGSPPHVNNPDLDNRAETIVDFTGTTASPVSAISPIVDCH